jgi:hypothetical protein
MRLSPIWAQYAESPCTIHDGTGGARPLLERQIARRAHDGLVGAAELQVQEAERIEQRLRRVPERLDQRLLRGLRGGGAIGMAAHAIDDDDQRSLL